VSVDAMLMDRYEVSQEEYEKLVIGNPSKFKEPKNPIERVRWMEAALYCNGRSTAEGLEPCYDEATYECNFQANGYRLPTEAEWEYAARAGNDAEYAFGSAENRLSDYAWFKENSVERTHPVGMKKPNAWGLYDMYGNVGEWCQDVYDGEFYEKPSEANPCNITGGPNRVLRGGSWSSVADRCRSASRTGEAPGSPTDSCFSRPDIGFRCVRRAPAAKAEDPVATQADAKSP
jgi:sulfatase modifying factor 1